MIKIPAMPYYVNAMKSEYLASNASTSQNVTFKVYVGFENWLAKTYGAKTERIMGKTLIFDSHEKAVYFKLRFG